MARTCSLPCKGVVLHCNLNQFFLVSSHRSPAAPLGQQRIKYSSAKRKCSRCSVGRCWSSHRGHKPRASALEECCGQGYVWSIPYGNLNDCFLTQGTPVCSHMAAVSQWRVGAALYAPLLNVPSQCWICAALEGSYIASRGSFMEKN